MRRGCGGTTLGLLGEGAGRASVRLQTPRAGGVSRPLLFFSDGVDLGCGVPALTLPPTPHL